jgi:hypothetical protein
MNAAGHCSKSNVQLCRNGFSFSIVNQSLAQGFSNLAQLGLDVS